MGALTNEYQNLGQMTMATLSGEMHLKGIRSFDKSCFLKIELDARITFIILSRDNTIIVTKLLNLALTIACMYIIA